MAVQRDSGVSTSAEHMRQTRSRPAVPGRSFQVLILIQALSLMTPV